MSVVLSVIAPTPGLTDWRSQTSAGWSRVICQLNCRHITLELHLNLNAVELSSTWPPSNAHFHPDIPEIILPTCYKIYR